MRLWIPPPSRRLFPKRNGPPTKAIGSSTMWNWTKWANWIQGFLLNLRDVVKALGERESAIEWAEEKNERADDNDRPAVIVGGRTGPDKARTATIHAHRSHRMRRRMGTLRERMNRPGRGPVSRDDRTGRVDGNRSARRSERCPARRSCSIATPRRRSTARSSSSSARPSSIDSCGPGRCSPASGRSPGSSAWRRSP